MMRGHVRKGHWHMFRTGRRKDASGNKIPLSQQGQLSRWIPPSVVGDQDNMIPGVREYQFKAQG
jgi:hypothetical protein